MLLASQVLAGVVAVLHVYFLVLEMFLWTTRFGQKTFKRSEAEQESSRILAANQGLYNGFLSAGLIWSLLTGNLEVRIFFFSCVTIAGIYGGATVGRAILIIQAIPAAVGITVTTLAMRALT